jgi:hypothetical protein
MSSWGNLDNVAATGTVTAYAGNTRVNGSGTAFTTDLKEGDYLTITGSKFQIATIASNTALELTANGKAVSGATAYVQQGPKFVANVSSGNLNEPTIQDVYGIDRVEIVVAENKARGVASHTGWVTYKTYTDALGQTRNKSEVLVALSKNFASNAAGSLFGTGAGVDADDDTVAADYQILINTQPANVSNAAGNAAVFFAVASTDPTGQTLTYQWQENNTVAWATLTNAGVYSGTTTNTLTISDVTGKDNYQYRVVVSGVGGADSVTSTAAELEVV